MSEYTYTHLALVAQVEEEYGTTRIAARVCAVTDTGELHNPQWTYGGWDMGAEYYGFAVHAYVGDSLHTTPEVRGIWGNGHSYAPHRIESAKQAQAIARVLTKVERGLDKANEDDGYLRDSLDGADFAGYLLRIAKVLRIKDIRVRRLPNRPDYTGEACRKVNGSALQMWCSDVDQTARSGKMYELVKR